MQINAIFLIARPRFPRYVFNVDDRLVVGLKIRLRTVPIISLDDTTLPFWPTEAP
jgi:hypothetical protein